MINRREFLKNASCAAAGMLAYTSSFGAEETETRIGIIGLDTSHATAFTKIINNSSHAEMRGMRVVGAYPYGSRNIESSASRIPEITKEIKSMGVNIYNAIEDLLAECDAILLLTNDGNVHYEQLVPVLEKKKPVFIDKPIGANLSQVIKIFDLIHRHNVPVFSSSALRYLEGAQKARYENAVGKVIGGMAYSPQKTEPTHTDLYWYGIHGVEILYTMMGTGCEAVQRITGAEQDMVIGRWSGHRIGTYKGDVQGRQHYGGIAYGSEGILHVGPFNGYEALVKKIAQFFRDGISPVAEAETVEIYTFMEAADESKRRKGAWVDLKQVYNKAKSKG